jgi:hypothetical protein
MCEEKVFLFQIYKILIIPPCISKFNIMKKGGKYMSKCGIFLLVTKANQ